MATFRVTMKCPKFILIAAQTYNLTQRKCIDSQGNERIDLTLGIIIFVFDPPPHTNPKIMSKVDALKWWAIDEEGNKSLINERWLKIDKKSLKKIPPKPKRSNFSKDIGDLIILLARAFGKEDSCAFEIWMFPFIQLILDGSQHLDW